MLTKNQASQVADGIIAQQRELLDEAQDANSKRVSFFYRCPEMAKLPLREQAALLNRAKAIVQREWLIYLTMLVLFAAVPLTWFVSRGESSNAVRVIPILALSAVALNVLRSLIVRLVVRILAGRGSHTD